MGEIEIKKDRNGKYVRGRKRWGDEGNGRNERLRDERGNADNW